MSCYRSILIAYDGSADAIAALRHAASLARDQHARIVLLTVVPRMPVPPVDAAAAIAARDLERSFSRVLHDANEALPPDVGLDTRLVYGKPARQILDIAREHDCDLIVMGSHGHGRLHGALIGCTSATVLRESTIPVLLLRAPTADRQENAAAPPSAEATRASIQGS
jgi:nucleotide-binding universal stress UspA family protein